MDVKVCDRCRRGFRTFGEGLSGFVPMEEPGKAASDQAPPGGLKHMNTLTLPAAYRQEKPATDERRLTVVKFDLCAQCVVEFVPVVARWLEEKRPASAAKG